MFTGLDNPTHWLFSAIVAVIVFGPKRLSELGRSLGSGIRGFRDSLGGSDDDSERERPTAMVETQAPDAGSTPASDEPAPVTTAGEAADA